MKFPGSGSALALLSVLFGCASGAPSNTSSVTAPGADVAAYATFGFPSASESAGAAMPPVSILDANIQEAIRKQLLEKGYREVESNPDLWIRFETAAYIAEKASKPSPVRIGVGVGSWGGPVGGGVGTSVPVGRGGAVSAQETRLTIRAVEQEGNREVWVGTSTGEITENLDAGAVEKVVAGSMAEFPTKRK